MPTFPYSLVSIRELKYPAGWDILGKRKEGQAISELIAHFNEAVPETKVVDLANELARMLAGRPLADWI